MEKDYVLPHCLRKIIPSDSIEKYFNVEAVMRFKKSGTKNIPQKEIEQVIEIVSNYFNILPDYEYKDNKLLIKNLKIYNQVNLEKLKKNNKLLYFNDGEFYLSKKNNYFVIKKTSTTNNLNVIFNLQLIDNINNNFNLFENYLETEIKKFI
jgi:hypothetical protein